jgi:hypothetical protein
MWMSASCCHGSYFGPILEAALRASDMLGLFLTWKSGEDTKLIEDFSCHCAKHTDSIVETTSTLEFHLVGGFNPSEKYESQWEGLSQILWKIKHL